MGYRDNPPLPRFSECRTPLQIRQAAYEKFRKERNLEAWRDRQVARDDCLEETRRLAFIAKVHARYPQVNPRAIAESLDPWNLHKFKRLVAQAIAIYLKESR